MEPTVEKVADLKLDEKPKAQSKGGKKQENDKFLLKTAKVC